MGLEKGKRMKEIRNELGVRPGKEGRWMEWRVEYGRSWRQS